MMKSISLLLAKTSFGPQGLCRGNKNRTMSKLLNYDNTTKYFIILMLK